MNYPFSNGSAQPDASGFDAAGGDRHFYNLFRKGITDLEIVTDVPTRTGYDSDHSRAQGKVGKSGIPISSIDDMELLFQGIPPEEIKVLLKDTPTAFILLAFYVAMLKKQGTDLKNIRGILNSNISEDPAPAGYIYPVGDSLRIADDVAAWCKEELPSWVINAPSAALSTAGGSAANQEFAERAEYAQAAANGDGDFISGSETAELPENPSGDGRTAKLAAIRRQRNHAKCDQLLQFLNDKAASGENLLPAVIEAAEARCTLGEIADTLREVFGVY